MASWKKVVIQAANITDAALVATEAAVAVANDSILFVDSDDSTIKRDSVADFAAGLRGTSLTGNGNSGLKSTNGVLALNNGLDVLGSLDNSGGDQDVLLVYDTSATEWKVATASAVGSAGSDTNTTYALSAADTSSTKATLTLTSGGSGSGVTDDIVFQSVTDATIDTDATSGAEIIKIGVSTTPTNITSIFNTDIEIGADTDNKIDFGANSNKIDVTLASTAQFTIQNGAMVPAAADLFDIGTSSTFMKKGFFKDLDVTNAIDGSVTGSAGSAGTATTVSTSATDSENTVYIAGFVNNNSSAQTPQVTSGIHFDSATDKITAVGFVGDLTGTADDATNAVTATNANHINVTNHDTSSNDHYFLFAEGTSGNQDVYTDSSGLTWTPSSQTLAVTNLTVTGTETKVNTTNLSVTDKIIEIANGSAGPTDADGAGIQVNIAEVVLNEAGDNTGAVATSFAKMPELKWNNNSVLTGWTVSDYNSAEANADFAIPVMTVAGAAPTGSNNQAGQGSFYTDTSSGTEALYVYL